MSHNDKDHQGGASAIIAAYPKAIDRVFFLQDRPIEQIALYGVVKRALEGGNLLSEPIRLERDDQPRVIFSEPTKDLSLELIHPTFQANLEAQNSAQPNETSAVLVLFCGKRKVVYPGDSSIGDWRRIRSYLGGPILADILSVPHHGGNVYEHRYKRKSTAESELREKQNLDWLYSEGVQCKFAIVSVGTTNNYGHPKSAAISALRSSHAQVICTQITQSCYDDLELLRPGVRRAVFHSQSRGSNDLTSGGHSRNVACAGTVIAEIGRDSVTIRGFDEHQMGVEKLVANGGHPLCRNS